MLFSRTSKARPRRRGAPQSVVVRRLLAVALAVCAVLLALRERSAPEVAAAEPTSVEEAVIPLVLPIEDAAVVSVLRVGQRVDIYAAYGEEPPALAASGLELLGVGGGEDTDLQGGSQHSHVVVGITPAHTDLVEDLLAARSIVATVSAVHF